MVLLQIAKSKPIRRSHFKHALSSRYKLISSCVLKDILIDELIHRMGWIQRSKDDNRQKIENRIHTQWIVEYYDVGDTVSTNPNEENLAKLK